MLVNLSYFDVIEKGKKQQKARKDKKEMSEKGDLDRISVRLWKSKIFGQESTYSKDFFFKSVDELRFVKKCQNRIFKVNFQCQKSTEFNQIFSKKDFI